MTRIKPISFYGKKIYTSERDGRIMFGFTRKHDGHQIVWKWFDTLDAAKEAAKAMRIN